MITMLKTLSKIQYLVAMALIILLSGCGNKSDEPEQPSTVAIAFFDAVYNQQDLPAALKLTTPQYSRILNSYHTVERVQQVLFNRRYDKVEIEEDNSLSGAAISTAGEQDKAYVTLMFDGTYNGNRFRDLKKVVMVKQQGKWRVDKLKADVYR